MTTYRPSGGPASTYDLVLRGGTLLDPGQGVYDRRDVPFKDGKVAAVAERIDPQTMETSAEVIDVTGKLVTPGLVDLHGHFYHGGSPIDVDADEHCLSAGVTTGIDAGSAGWANYMTMRDYVFAAKRTRLLAFLHIGAVGLVLNHVLGGELWDMRVADPDRTADTIKENPGFLLGVKVRMDANAVTYWEAREALRRARSAADKAGVKLMVHVSRTPIPLPHILDVLGPGDIASHIFNGHPEGILDRTGNVRPEVKAAVQRGVVMDVAHAGVACDVEVARAGIRQGFFPTTISTDIHTPPPGWAPYQVYRLNDLVSKFHALGLPLEDAVAAGMMRPAKTLGLEKEIGSLALGMAADAAVFDQREGRFVWQDGSNHTVDGTLRLDTFLTIRDGTIVWREGRLTQTGDC